jgi:hypothetical protein
VITFVLDDDGVLVNEESGEPVPMEEDPAYTETMPDWLWKQHVAQPTPERDA